MMPPAPDCPPAHPCADSPALAADTPPEPPVPPYFWGLSHVAAGLLVALTLFYFAVMTPLWHGEIWTHLAYGRWIVAERALPAEEPFSNFADPAKDSADTEWLAQVVCYLSFRGGQALAGGAPLRQLAGGVDALRALFGVLLALRLGLLLLAFRRWTDSLSWAAAGAFAVLLLSRGYSTNQSPQIFGEVCFAALLCLLAAPCLSWRALVGAALLFALWANLHDSFVAGLALVAVFFVGRALDAARRDGVWNLRGAFADSQVRRLALLLPLAVLACLLNPYGPALFGHVFTQALDENVRTLGGSQPLNFGEAGGPHWLYLGGLIALVLAQAGARRPLAALPLALLLTFGIAPLVQQRLIVWWWPLLLLLLLPLLQDIVDRLGLGRVDFSSRRNLAKTFLAVALPILALLWCGPVRTLIAGAPTALRVSMSPATPAALALRLAQPAADAKSPLAETLKAYPGGVFRGRILASPALANYLLWAGDDPDRLFADSRAGVFSAPHWQDYRLALSGKGGWWEVLERYRVNLVLLEPALYSELAEQMRKDAAWRVVLDEADAPRSDPRTRRLIAVRKRPF